MTPTTITASSLLSRADDIDRDHRLLTRVKALQGMIAYEGIFRDAGFTEGKIDLTESNDDGNRYEIVLNVDDPLPGKTDEETEEAFKEAVDLREFADDITSSGSGEFFTVEIDFAKFREEWIAPLEKDLIHQGVTIDLAP